MMKCEAIMQWQCMERAGIESSVLERIRDLQQSMQSRKMRTIKSSVAGAVETLCKQLASGEDMKLSDVSGWFGSE
jgi:aspartate aminotransferase-like enzyme